MPIAALVTMTPLPGREAELMERLVDVLRDVRTEPGNLMAVVLKDPKQPEVILEFAVYRDQAAIEAHRVAPHSLAKGPAVQALLKEPYQARYFDPVDWPE